MIIHSNFLHVFVIKRSIPIYANDQNNLPVWFYVRLLRNILTHYSGSYLTICTYIVCMILLAFSVVSTRKLGFTVGTSFILELKE